MSVLQIIGMIVVIIGVIFIAFGVIGLFRFSHFYEKILIASKIDTVGTLTVIFGLMLYHGASFFTLRLLLILVIVFLLSPLCTHTLARSAYFSETDEGG